MSQSNRFGTIRGRLSRIVHDPSPTGNSASDGTSTPPARPASRPAQAGFDLSATAGCSSGLHKQKSFVSNRHAKKPKRPGSSLLTFLFALSGCGSFLAPVSVLAWGNLGHRIITENTAIALKSSAGRTGKAWPKFLSHHRFELGFYSVLPDSAFRDQDGVGGKREGPLHFFDLDVVKPEFLLPSVPVTYDSARLRIREALKLESNEAADALGGSPWRVLQLLQLARAEAALVKMLPTDSARAAKTVLLLGLLSHYSADAAMPYHASRDYDGYGTGNGGIHRFYETTCVDELDPSLTQPTLALAREREAAWWKKWDPGKAEPGEKAFDQRVLQFMLNFYSESLSLIKELAELDRKHAITSKSVSEPKTPAKRRSPAQACARLRESLIQNLARGISATQWLWTKALPAEAPPEGLGDFHIRDFERNPEYIPLR